MDLVKIKKKIILNVIVTFLFHISHNLLAKKSHYFNKIHSSTQFIECENNANLKSLSLVYLKLR